MLSTSSLQHALKTSAASTSSRWSSIFTINLIKISLFWYFPESYNLPDEFSNSIWVPWRIWILEFDQKILLKWKIGWWVEENGQYSFSCKIRQFFCRFKIQKSLNQDHFTFENIFNVNFLIIRDKVNRGRNEHS